jgi:hypothetical protein
MYRSIYLWFIRTFLIVSNSYAKKLNLKHYRNVYGIEINYINCRSLWCDSKKRIYRATNLE